jgi:hypothetical protein
MFFNCAFMRASSALIVSTYVDGSAFEVLEAAGGSANFSGAAALSKQASLSRDADIDLQSEVSAIAACDSAQTAIISATIFILFPGEERSLPAPLHASTFTWCSRKTLRL